MIRPKEGVAASTPLILPTPVPPWVRPTSDLFQPIFDDASIRGNENPNSPTPATLPESIALDPDGNLFVFDTKNNQVQKFNVQGKFSERTLPVASVDIHDAESNQIAIDGLGSLYVSNGYTRTVTKYALAGDKLVSTVITSPTHNPVKHISAMTVDTIGNVYIVDPSGDTIVQKFDSVGNHVNSFAIRGTGTGQCQYPSQVGVAPDGAVYLLDLDDRILKFDANGNFLIEYGKNGVGNIRVDQPTGIAFDEQNNIYVVDRDSVQKFNQTGTVKIKMGRRYHQKTMYYPESVAVDKFGYIYVSDMNLGYVQKFDPNGVLQTK